MENTLSRNDIATAFKVTNRTINNWQRAGILPPPDYSIGNTDRWKESTVEGALKGRSADGKAA